MGWEASPNIPHTLIQQQGLILPLSVRHSKKEEKALQFPSSRQHALDSGNKRLCMVKRPEA